MKPLAAPAYTAEEQELAISSLDRLTVPLVAEFLAGRGLRKAKTKPEMMVRVQDALEAGTLSYGDLFLYLNSIEAWGRQHVTLFDGPKEGVASWLDPAWVSDRASAEGLSELLNAEQPLALPRELTLSSIEYSGAVLRISAVERREGIVREHDYDTEKRLEDDTTIIYRAYKYLVYRGFIIFEWDLVANQAALRISQLPSGEKYEDARSRFEALIASLLDLGGFSPICLRSVIARLHELEEMKKPEARSQGIAYRTIEGRTVEGRGAGGSLGMMGESVVDTTMSNVRKVSVGHTGNFYWLPADVNVASDNPLTNELHVIMNGEARRTNFPVYSPEPQIRYVLQRIRAIASGASRP